MDKRDGFYFHRSFRDAIDQLPQKDQLALYRAITSYGLDSKEPEKLTPTQNAFFMLVKPVLAKGINKAANGKKGGSKAKANGKQTESKTESASSLLLSDNNSDSESDKGQGSNPSDYDKGRRESAPAPAPGRAFTEFWNAYPSGRGGDREEAWNAWRELNPDTATAWRIMDSLDGWAECEQWQEQGGRFIPGAAKFLRERRWEVSPALQCGGGYEPMPVSEMIRQAAPGRTDLIQHYQELERRSV